MKRFNTRSPRIAALPALVLGAVALLALSGVAAAKDRHGDDHGHRGHHHHHQFPMREAGTISSFDATTGKLTIGLTDGGSVTGLVTEGTEIKCEGVDDHRNRHSHGGSEPGDDNGGHGNEPGDDNGGQIEPGDDHGGHGNEPGDDNVGDGAGPGPSGESGAAGEGAPSPVPGEAASCTVASLVPGAVVGEAELRLEGGSTVFKEVELGIHS